MTDDQDAEIAQYRSLSALAVTGLVLGLLSAFWMIDPLLWFLPVPPAGIVFSLLALRQIRLNAPELVGRKAALLGLILAVLFGTAAPSNWLCYRWAVCREARQFAGQWFDFLAQGQPQKAYQLTLHPRYRPPLDDEALQDTYRPGSAAEKELENYRSQPLVLALTALGGRAQVRFYQTGGMGHSGERDLVIQVYAVTYRDPETDEKKSFFVSLEMHRLRLKDGRAQWQLSRATGGGKPAGL
jgi:hypothetical protein